MTRFVLFFTLLSVAGCTSQMSDVDAAPAIDAAVGADGGRDGSMSTDAGHDASPTLDSGLDASPTLDAGHDASPAIDAGHDAWLAPDAYVDQSDTGGIDAAPPMCSPPTPHVCYCATGWYCLRIGASCLAATAPCPGG